MEGVYGVGFDRRFDVSDESLDAREEGRERVDDDGAELTAVHVRSSVLRRGRFVSKASSAPGG